jgi:hypothetical protein
MHSYIAIVCCIEFIWSIVCFALGNSVPDPLFQEQVCEEPEVFISGQQGSVLDQLCTYFSCLFYSMYKLHDSSKLARTYARNC